MLVFSLIITNRKLATGFPSSYRWTAYVGYPPKWE